MNRLNEMHEKAMSFSDEAFLARRKGNLLRAEELARKAFELEAAAADLLKDRIDIEPSRSVLYRSAASMAIDCGEYREAERLIAQALVGNPPNEIAEELRDLLEQVNFDRHLKLKGISLEPDELQISISGDAVGYGLTQSEVFVERIKDTERIMHRTLERLMDVKFRDRGAVSPTVRENYEIYWSVPRAASFAITLRIGGSQKSFPEFDQAPQAISEVFECLKLYNADKEDVLRERFKGNDAYFRNFIGLAKRIAPDGKKVRQVGFTRVDNQKEIHLPLTRLRTSPEVVISNFGKIATDQAEEREIIVSGRLLYADATKSKQYIRLIDNAGIEHNVVVPEGLMDDIVKPLWDELVTVRGKRSKRRIHLIEIDKAS